MIRYVLAKRDSDILGCDRCDSEAPTTPVKMGMEQTPGRMCPYCYETELGTILQYPEQHRGMTTLARGLCQALNLIAPGGKVRNG